MFQSVLRNIKWCNRCDAFCMVPGPEGQCITLKEADFTVGGLEVEAFGHINKDDLSFSSSFRLNILFAEPLCYQNSAMPDCSILTRVIYCNC